jgi:hypothetical protein
VALFNVLFDIAAKTTSFEASMGRVEQRFNQLSSQITNVGRAIGLGFSGDAIASQFTRAIDAGDQLYRAVLRIGDSAEHLSQLKFAGESTGVQFDAITMAMSKMQQAISKGGLPFAQIGVDLAKLKQLAPEQQFEVIAEAISRLKDPADRTRAAVEFFGRSGADLLPLLSQGASGIEKLRSQSDQLGLTLTTLSAKQLHEAKESIDAMDRSMTGLWQTIATKASPTITALGNGMRTLMGGETELEKLTDQLKQLEGIKKSLTMSGEYVGDPKQIAEMSAQIDELNERIAKLKDESAEGGSGAAAPGAITGALTKALGFGPDALQEIHISSQRMEKDVNEIMREFYAGLNEETKSEIEQLHDKASDFKFAIDELLGAGLITPAQAQQRAQDFSAKNMLPELEYIVPTVKKVQTQLQQTMIAMQGTVDSAATSMENAFEKFFANPMKVQFKGLLQAFIQTLDQMMAKQLTLTLFGANGQSGPLGSLFGGLFGAIGNTPGASGGGSGTSGGGAPGAGGLIGSLLGGLGRAFGGGLAGGGPVQSGRWYLAGENGPEPIWGGGSGAYAAGYGASGAGSIAPTFNIDARGATVDAISMLPGVIQRASDLAVSRMTQMKARGLF